MEEVEVPLEGAQEEIHHHAQHSKERWLSGVALSSCILAVAAAVTAMLSGQHANKALMDQIDSSDLWSQFQANSIKLSMMNTKTDLFFATGKEAPATDKEKVEKYEKEKESLSEKAKAKKEASEHNLEKHEVYARGVTMFQVAIAIAAISALTRKKGFWLVGLVFGVIGAAFLAQGLMLH